MRNSPRKTFIEEMCGVRIALFELRAIIMKEIIILMVLKIDAKLVSKNIVLEWDGKQIKKIIAKWIPVRDELKKYVENEGHAQKNNSGDKSLFS